MVWGYIIAGLVFLGLVVAYYFKVVKTFEKSNPEADKYIWVGPGEDPFKKKN